VSIDGPVPQCLGDKSAVGADQCSASPGIGWFPDQEGDKDTLTVEGTGAVEIEVVEGDGLGMEGEKGENDGGEHWVALGCGIRPGYA